jgi:hypothetical protein
MWIAVYVPGFLLNFKDGSLNMMKRTLVAVASAVALITLSDAAQAGVIIEPVGISASAGLPVGDSAPTALGNIIDQSGLSAPYVSGVTNFSAYVATTTASYSCSDGCFPELGGVAGIPATITFDLGLPTVVDAIVIWNQSGTASLVRFDLKGIGGNSVTSLGSFTMPSSSQDSPEPAEVFTFAPGMFSSLEMDITGNACYDAGTKLNEVAFEAVVPEPVSMTILGSGIVGLGVIRRRKAA